MVRVGGGPPPGLGRRGGLEGEFDGTLEDSGHTSSAPDSAEGGGGEDAGGGVAEAGVVEGVEGLKPQSHTITSTQCLAAINFLINQSTAAPTRFAKEDLFFPRLDWHISSRNYMFVEKNFADYLFCYGYIT